MLLSGLFDLQDTSFDSALAMLCHDEGNAIQKMARKTRMVGIFPSKASLSHLLPAQSLVNISAVLESNYIYPSTVLKNNF